MVKELLDWGLGIRIGLGATFNSGAAKAQLEVDAFLFRTCLNLARLNMRSIEQFHVLICYAN